MRTTLKQLTNSVCLIKKKKQTLTEFLKLDVRVLNTLSEAKYKYLQSQKESY